MHITGKSQNHCCLQHCRCYCYCLRLAVTTLYCYCLSIVIFCLEVLHASAFLAHLGANFPAIQHYFSFLSQPCCYYPLTINSQSRPTFGWRHYPHQISARIWLRATWWRDAAFGRSLHFGPWAPRGCPSPDHRLATALAVLLSTQMQVDVGLTLRFFCSL